jgi:nicotinate dehydrogenase subunit B
MERQFIQDLEESSIPVVEHDPQIQRRLSRRRLLQAAGASAGLVVVWSSRGAAQEASPVASPAASPAATPAAAQRPTIPTDLDSYLAVNEDGTVSLATAKVEFGQGIETGFRQLVAEELSLPFEHVSIVMGITDRTAYDLGTFGSLSTRFTGPRIRQAAAEMREWLKELGAESLGSPADQLMVEGGKVFPTSDNTKSVTYADLAAGKKAARELREDVPLKDPATYTVVGQPIPRVDIPLKVTGEMKYGIDSFVEGMVHGKIIRPPAIGATLQSIDFSEAEKLPGVIGTFRDGDFAGLAAERIEQAEAALAAVKAVWSEVNTGNSDKNIHDLIKTTAHDPIPITLEATGNADEETPEPAVDPLANVTNPQTWTFTSPYVNHAPIEPRNALVQVSPGRVDVWASTQDPFSTRTAVATALGRDPQQVVVTPLASGGAFGSKILTPAAVEAARLAQAFNRPVKLIWSRVEEFMYGQYRPAMRLEITSGLNDEGRIAGWKYDLYSSAYYPETAERPTGAAADWSSNIAEIYDVPNAQTMHYQGQSPLSPYFWRVNGAAPNTFAREVTLDILAEMAGQDPVTFRRNHLANNPRMLAVLEAVVEKAGWTPAPGSTGQGIGVGLSYDGGSYVGEVAKVQVDSTTGQIQVLHVDVAFDCGLVVNPAGVQDQAEGSVVMSLSPTLREAITFENGKVTNPSFEQYQPITMKETPTVDVILVEDKANPMGGVGEPAVAPVPAAVANAVYDAIGVRLFEMPFTPERVLAAIQAKGGS